PPRRADRAYRDRTTNDEQTRGTRLHAPGPGRRCAAYGGKINTMKGAKAPYSSAFGRRPLPHSEIKAGPEKRGDARQKSNKKVLTAIDSPSVLHHNCIMVASLVQ